MLLPPMPVIVVVVRLHRMHSIDADYSYVRRSVVCLSVCPCVRVSVRLSRPRVSSAKWLNRSRCRVGCKLYEPKHEGTNYWMGLHVTTEGRGTLGVFSSIAKHCRIPVCCNGTSVSPATTAEMVDVYAVGRDKLVWACTLAPHDEYDGSVLRRLRCCLP